MNFYSFSSPEPGVVVICEDVAEVRHTEETLNDAIVKVRENKAQYEDQTVFEAELMMLGRALAYLKKVNEWWAARKPVVETAVMA